jgi:peptide/nickel transport system substrate-binding protein
MPFGGTQPRRWSAHKEARSYGPTFEGFSSIVKGRYPVAWRTKSVLFSVALMLAVAGCSGGSPGANGNGAPTSEDISNSGGRGTGLDPNATGPAPAVPGAKSGGEITVLSNVSPATFDPTRTYYQDSAAILSDLVVRSLTTYKFDPATGDDVLVPDLATDLGTANADNTEWTFTLKKGIKYQDGTPITADDVAYATKRAFAFDELPGPAPVETYGPIFFKDGDSYKGPFKDGEHFAGVSVKGNSVTFHMSRPFPDMPYLASFPAFSPIPQAKDNVNSYGLKPLATGPYEFASYNAGSELKLVKNKYWDPNSDPVRHQYANGWDFKWGQDSSTMDNTIINDQGTAQTTLTYDNLLAPDYASAVQKGAKDRVVTGTQPCTAMWYLDSRKIKQLTVRQALGWAYPYQAAWKTAGEIVGLTRVPGTTILPPGAAGREDNGQSLPGQDGQTTDPAKSRALLARAGYKPGQYEIRFLYEADDAVSKQVMGKVKAGLEAGGFKATPVPTTIAKYRDDLYDDSVDVNVRAAGWCSDWPNGSSWFPSQWRCGQSLSINPAQFCEHAADMRQNSILNTMSGATENDAWGKFDSWMEHKYYPNMVTGYYGVLTIHGSKIGGMRNDNVKGMPTFTQLYVS